MDKRKKEELIRQTRKEYFRNWRANHKEKIKAYNQSYWERKALGEIKKGE